MTTKHTKQMTGKNGKIVLKEGGQEMAEIKCTGCGARKRFDTSNFQENDVMRGIIVCGNCGTLNPFEIEQWTLTFVPPKETFGGLNNNVSQSVQSFYSEANLCFMSGISRPSLVMARASVEQALKEKGIIESNLEKRIDRARILGMLDDRHVALAHGSRLCGNEAVHEIIDVEPSEVPAILACASRIINAIFK